MAVCKAGVRKTKLKLDDGTSSTKLFITCKIIKCESIFFYFRGDHIVPSMDEAFPKKKAEEVKTNVRFQG